MRRINEGDRVPNFSLSSDDGRTVSTKDILGKGPLVIYFYPHDGTPGCTAQACSFRDMYEELKDEGATVIGISSDSVESHKKFKEKHRLPYMLLSDEGGRVREMFGVPKSMGLLPGRVSYVVDREGVVKYTFSSQTRVSEHVHKALDAIRRIKDEK